MRRSLAGRWALPFLCALVLMAAGTETSEAELGVGDRGNEDRHVMPRFIWWLPVTTWAALVLLARWSVRAVRRLAWRLLEAGFEVRLISSVALARTREALHNSWDKNDPKDAQVCP